MRRRMIVAVQMMILLCLLCACAGKANDPLQAPMDFRAELLAKGGCAFELEALADTDGQCWALTLACELDADGSGTVTVLAPESISGIAAVTDGETGSLTYEGLRLGLGTLPGTELAPAAAPGRLVRAWARDWIASAGAEGGTLLACYEDGRLTVRTWFDASGVPVRAELATDGRTRFTAEIRNFQWTHSPQRRTVCATEHTKTRQKAGDINETAKEDLG